MVTDFEPIAENKSVTFYRPVSIPYGFFALGHYNEPTRNNLRGAYVLVARDNTSRDSPRPALKLPLDYNLIWMSLKERVYVWEPLPPVGYRALGFVVTICSNVGYHIEPDVQLVRCVREDLTLDAQHLVATNSTLTTHSKGVSVNPSFFFCGMDISCGDVLNLCCLKNSNLGATMPNLEQVKALIHHYGPTVYFHPDDVYLPSSVPWYFENSYSDDFKHGCLETAEVYVLVRPATGGAFTDIIMLICFPYAGLDTVTLKLFNLNIEMINKKAGEEVGHWEYFALRISNFDGQLWRVYLPDHSGNKLVEATCLEFIEGSNKPIIYSSKFRHASFPNAGTYIQGRLTNFGIGVKDEVAKSDMFIDTSKKYKIVVAEYLGDGAVVEPEWMRDVRHRSMLIQWTCFLYEFTGTSRDVLFNYLVHKHSMELTV
ncbi:hypothetical protein CTI12_AA253890 [Artemisia annua]|uniref:Uncharacterized protein n=1 Tax=Artemisia annua TaxID=35608 RepID=A0A2U1NK93_ARTAN|nr:hypothetical protein CTI12_AA253890 [Artemisia annua]